jgi:hypothetical protein
MTKKLLISDPPTGRISTTNKAHMHTCLIKHHSNSILRRVVRNNIYHFYAHLNRQAKTNRALITAMLLVTLNGFI